MQGMLPAKTAVFAELQLVRRRSLVFRLVVVSLLAFGANQRDIDSHGSLLWRGHVRPRIY
jgi:hypothetical protein